MNVGTLDRKSAILLVAGVSAILLLRFVVMTEHSTPVVVAASESTPLAEARLKRVREKVATLPGHEQQLRDATAELEKREKGILKADTAAQAQAHLQELLHKAGEANGIDIRGMEDARVRPLGNDYGEAIVYVRFSCRIEQLVNLMAQLANEPELVATNDLQVTGSNDKEKKLQVRLGISGMVTRKIAQEKKGGTGF